MMISCSSVPFLIVTYFALFALEVKAQNAQNLAKSVNLDLIIELKDLPATEVVGKTNLQFVNACRVFGTFLIKNQGLWATGPFRSVKCEVPVEGRVIGGEASKTNDWRLEISADGYQKTFTFYFREPEGRERIITSFTLESGAGPIALMSKKKLNQILAFHLIQRLPFQSSFPVSGATPDGVVLAGPVGTLNLITPPEELTIFEVTRAGGVWRTKKMGIAKMLGTTDGKIAWKVEGVGSKSLRPAGGVYFAQQSTPRDEIIQRSAQIVEDEVGNFVDAIFGIGKSAYVGSRIGIPIAGHRVMKSAMLIGLFADLRSGIASGVKFNYDFVPLREFIDEQGADNFKWSRFQVGYSFLKPVNWWIISQLDATPRLGVSSLKYEYTPRDSTGGNRLQFEMNRAPTIGLEIGAEKNTFLARFRLWAFGSFSLGILPVDKNHTTTSTRLGLDIYRELFKIKRFNFALLGFSSAESTNVKKTIVATSSSAASAAAITLTSVYAGGGVTLTW
jgi:hypothetical protein